MKRLVRKTHDKKLTGLCAGIADYIGIDATVVRLIVLFATIMTGIVPGIVFYIVASVITPEETHHA